MGIAGRLEEIEKRHQRVFNNLEDLVHNEDRLHEERPLGVEHYRLVHFNLILGGPNAWLEIRVDEDDVVLEAKLHVSAADGHVERKFPLSKAQVLYNHWID